MPKKKKEQAEAFFAGIQDPIEMRRSILESSKELVQYLQRAERFKKIRAEKEEEVNNLKKVTREIHILVRKLKSSLPKTKLRARLHKHEEKLAEMPEEELVIKEKPIVKKEAPKEAETELEKLEQELGAIEGRLTKLT